MIVNVPLEYSHSINTSAGSFKYPNKKVSVIYVRIIE